MEQWLDGNLLICQVCGNKAKYRCPKCGLAYCSPSCYKNHNLSCISDFSKEQISKIPHKKASTESVIQMQKTLRNLDTQNVIEPIEVEPWSAWWIKPYIEAPQLIQNEPPKKVSPLLIYHLVDILYSYCYTLRLYNGDVNFDIKGAFECMDSISGVLTCMSDLTTVKSALSSCIERSRQPDIFVEFQWQVEVVHDVELCLQTTSHIIRALTETHAIAKESGKKRAYLKLQFFLSWAPTILKEDREKLKHDVHEYYTSLKSLLADINENL